jgi:hypothetical protein
MAFEVVEDDQDPAIHIARFDGSEVRTLASPASGFAWIPVHEANSPQPSSVPEASVSPNPGSEGKDVGLGFNLCDHQQLSGIDFLGDGIVGTAWIGVPTNDDGTCPKYSRPGKYVVAEDHTGDGVADSWLDLPWLCSVDCVPWDTTDLDGDRSAELIVASYFSITDYYFLAVRPNAAGQLAIAPILVAVPGHEAAQISGGKPLRIDAGGDAGYGSEILCQPPVIAWTWTFQAIDSNQPAEVHYAELELRKDGMFHVVGANDFTVPASDPTPLQGLTGPSCGVDWHPDA